MRIRMILIATVLFAACNGIHMPEEVEQAYASLPGELDYNRDVKRILSDKCFSCHGPDAKKQKANLRLDLSAAAYDKTTESGLKAIKPGSLSRSEVAHRILSEDPEYRMPTPKSHLELTAYEKAVLLKWIEQGAVYKPHWAFVLPQNTEPPKVKKQDWVKNDIDRYVLAAMENRKLQPTATADREVLIRRLSFDIRGISPSLQEVDAFVNSKDPAAYEKLVDAFLASSHYGERMAAYWLDVARFADSHGYLDDKHRDMTPWRDWVISAYNRNISYKDFITWQMAGDLLPNATKEQILATGFNRNHKQNSEAGIIEEEFRVEYVTDRTNTLGTAVMAMTIGCAKCHDHKYDPISQKDYYSLFAFFNSTFEKGSPNYGDDRVVPGPTLLLTTDRDDSLIAGFRKQVQLLEQQENSRSQQANQVLAKAGDAAIADVLSRKVVAKLGFDQALRKDEKTEVFINEADRSTDPTIKKAEFGLGVKGASLKYNDQTLVSFPATKVGYFERYEPFSLSFWLKLPENYPLATVFYSSEHHRYGYQGYDLQLNDNRLNFRLSHNYPHDAISVLSKTALPLNVWNHVAISYDGSSKAAGVKFYLNGKLIQTETKYDHLVKHIRQYYSIHKGPLTGFRFGEKVLDRSMPGGEVDEFHLFSNSLSPAEVEFLFARKNFPLKAYKKAIVPDPLMRTRKQLCDLYDSVKEVMVMGDLPKPRPTYVLARGVYSSPGAKVQPSAPAAIMPYASSLPKNRLGLTMWLFDEKNPLTARVQVNRVWQLIFGKGLVVSSDDFGNQGAMPSHPELLDHLAIWYRQHGWDTKALMKYIFMSATYQQSSVTEKNTVLADPDNKWLTRNPRYRFPAEMIRDNALSIAGLLSSKIGGPSVYPYQPAGLWEELSDKVWRYQYIQSTGEDLYRKSIYTIRKRTSVVPFLQLFDAPDRSVCTVRRQVSSSPMQSLALLNDPQMVEAARLLGFRMMQEGGKTLEEKMRYGFRLVTGRRPVPKEADLMKTLYETESKMLEKNPEKIKELFSNGEKQVKTGNDLQLATMASLALTLMNTDEFLTRK